MSEKVTDTWLIASLLGSGYAAVQMVTVLTDDGRTYDDVQQTGFGRYKTREEAETEMRQWSHSDAIRVGKEKSSHE